MSFTIFFSKKLEKNANFDFLNKFDLDKDLFRKIDLSIYYLFSLLIRKIPILPLSFEKRYLFKECSKIDNSQNLM